MNLHEIHHLISDVLFRQARPQILEINFFVLQRSYVYRSIIIKLQKRVLFVKLKHGETWTLSSFDSENFSRFQNYPVTTLQAFSISNAH